MYVNTQDKNVNAKLCEGRIYVRTVVLNCIDCAVVPNKVDMCTTANVLKTFVSKYFLKTWIINNMQCNYL